MCDMRLRVQKVKRKKKLLRYSPNQVLVEPGWIECCLKVEKAR